MKKTNQYDQSCGAGEAYLTVRGYHLKLTAEQMKLIAGKRK
ncbi:hypothetical protein [Bacillus sp. YC2]|nr:hypothetical protein [Bacillus sp. YC2]